MLGGPLPCLFYIAWRVPARSGYAHLPSRNLTERDAAGRTRSGDKGAKRCPEILWRCLSVSQMGGPLLASWPAISDGAGVCDEDMRFIVLGHAARVRGHEG